MNDQSKRNIVWTLYKQTWRVLGAGEECSVQRASQSNTKMEVRRSSYLLLDKLCDIITWRECRFSSVNIKLTLDILVSLVRCWTKAELGVSAPQRSHSPPRRIHSRCENEQEQHKNAARFRDGSGVMLPFCLIPPPHSRAAVWWGSGFHGTKWVSSLRVFAAPSDVRVPGGCLPSITEEQREFPKESHHFASVGWVTPRRVFLGTSIIPADTEDDLKSRWVVRRRAAALKEGKSERRELERVCAPTNCGGKWYKSQVSSWKRCFPEDGTDAERRFQNEDAPQRCAPVRQLAVPPVSPPPPPFSGGVYRQQEKMLNLPTSSCLH